ncbi:scavenger receptor cysteine-rich type 1 protein M130 [Microcaecilia unicolor]|uniref:Scavenger receptor cysteine-rich type 1 protein M130-like n=1 Tax=Microcaecilia unicolor TaxID=1415580 RepID=A0A6P7X0M9_9AMPH|nr:scavenger receptor cysteine-rich type 1 protein M130-like [Microcaecilia unicolor]
MIFVRVGWLLVLQRLICLAIYISGNVSSSVCVFPFTYNGKAYSTCIPIGRHDKKYWCSTTSNYDLDLKWKFCSVSELRGKSAVAVCHFPFIFDGKSYFSCTTAGRPDGKYWCAVTRNYDQDAQWILCSGSDDIRLMNGGDPCSGRVETFYSNGKWGTICHDNWGLTEAEVVCQEIKCGHAIAAPTNSYFGPSSGPLWANRVNCTQAHSRLRKCSGVWTKNNEDVKCNHSMEAGVICSDYGKLRLVNGENQCSGRVEIHFSNTWGTVCDDSWGMSAADVVCRQLGCGHALKAQGKASFGEGNGLVWLSAVQCTGREAYLWQCRSSTLGHHNCSHGSDAGVICSGSNEQYVKGRSTPGSFLLLLLCCVLGLLVLAMMGWIIKMKAESCGSGVCFRTSNKTSEIYESPKSLYENIEENSSDGVKQKGCILQGSEVGTQLCTSLIQFCHRSVSKSSLKCLLIGKSSNLLK